MGTRAGDQRSVAGRRMASWFGRWRMAADRRRANPAHPAHPAISPRLWFRRIGIRGDEGRRRLHWLVTTGLAVAVLVVGVAVTRSPLLRVDEVEVGPAPRTGAAAVRLAAAVRTGTAMMDLDPDAVARRVAALPWVDRAEVRRQWPGTVRITVSERQAVARVRSDGGDWLLVDRSGRVLQRQKDGPAAVGVPLDGRAQAQPGQFLPSGWMPSLRVVASLPSVLKLQVSSVAARGHDVQAHLAGGVVVDLAEAVQLRSKFVALSTLLDQPDHRCFLSINLDVASAPALTRRPGCA